MKREDDRHFRNAAKVLGIPVEDVTAEQRALAKRAAFGARSEEDALAQLKLFLRIGGEMCAPPSCTAAEVMAAPSPYAFQHSMHGFHVWEHGWPGWCPCEIGDHLQVGEWCWSEDGEDYNSDTFTTEAEAIADAVEQGHGGDEVYVAQVDMAATVVDVVLGGVDMKRLSKVTMENFQFAEALGEVSLVEWGALESRVKNAIRDWGKHDMSDMTITYTVASVRRVVLDGGAA